MGFYIKIYKRRMKYFTLKQQIIEKYCDIIIEFFNLIQNSEIMKELNYPIPSLYIGLNTIHRIFEYVLLKTKSIEKAIYYSQKTYYYYLEFIEQIYSSNLSNNLNHMDAVLFVYKKTIFDMYDGETNNVSNTMSNIMTLNDDNIIIDEIEWQIILSKLSKLTNILFNWENTAIDFDKRMNICNLYLNRFLIRIDQMFSTIEYLEIIQKKININYEKYEELLKEILERKERIKRERSETFSTEFDKNEVFLIKFCLEENVFHEKFNNGTMKEFVTWLYSK
jgi:hypothetical protein